LTEKPEARDCLRDLFLTDPFEDKNALKRKKGDRATGTCEWILGTEELTAWLAPGQTEGPQNQNTRILWLYGNPGTGKSTMAIFLAEELSDAFLETDGKTLAYFFCDSGFDNRKTATSIVRGLLLQLVQQHPQLLHYLLPKYNERGAELFKSFDALWTIFMAVAADDKTGRKYCIIDALDECDRESQEALLRQFEATFQGPNCTPNIRILVTSRPYPEIPEHLDRFAKEDLASFAQAKEDVTRCIEERVADLARRKHYTSKVVRQITDILTEKAEGTFLWVGLASEELKDVPSKDAVQVLQNMPSGLHSLYKKLLDTALERQGARPEVICRILSCVVVCLRPLSLLEFSEACQLYQEEEDTETRMQFTREQIASCRLMVIIQDEKVLLLHQSVKDYLLGAGAGFFINTLEAHAHLAYRCVDLLIEQFYGSGDSENSFSNYADLYWADHARMAEAEFEINDQQADFFGAHSPCREQWLQRLRSEHRLRLDGYRDIPRRFSVLHVAAWWGIPALIRNLFRGGHQYDAEKPEGLVDINWVDASRMTPIEQAAWAGHLNVFSILLSLGSEAGTQTLEAAAGNVNNGKEFMQLLFDQRGDQITITEEVLKAAAGNYMDGKEVMALLLDRRGDQITITEEVVKAVAGNYGDGKEVMALLLDRRGGQVTITEEVVSIIAGRFDKKVMALLLDRQGDQVTITEEVVKAAAGNGESGKEVMALLLDRRGDLVTITEEVVKTAAGNGESGKEVMALLLDRRGDQVAITEEVVKTAAGNPFNGKEVMALLLDRRGGQVTTTEEVVKTAAGNPFNGKEVMALLLDRQGDQVTITEEVVKAAAGNPFNGKEVMALLLDRRGDVVTITEEVVKTAAGNGQSGKEVMALLLDRRGDQVAITEEVVKAAAGNEKSGKEVMALLLDRRGAQITITEGVVRAAATCGQDQVLNLVQQSGHLSVKGGWFCIAQLYDAAKYGDVCRVEQLIHDGTNPDMKNIRGITPLWIAAANGHEAVVQVLAQKTDVDINSTEISGRSPLFRPSWEGNERVAAILVDAGADLDIADVDGETAITVATKNGHANVVRMLGRRSRA
jgi:DNA polymerase III delta prime subunit